MPSLRVLVWSLASLTIWTVAAQPSDPPPVAGDVAAALRAELEAMYETDQAQRRQMAGVEKEHGPNAPQLAELWRQQAESDRRNIARLEEIIAQHGWPRRSVVGPRAAQAAFLILQHAELSYQKKYVPLVRAAVKDGELNGSSLALLEDRILLREGGKQIYGSQVRRNEAGDWEPLPIEDEDSVDERRAAVGLPPLDEYLRGFAERSGGRVADRTNHRPAADAPPLAQALFDAADDARTAHGKLAAARPARGESALTFQLACRDFCRRFPQSPLYGAVCVLAAQHWGLLTEAQLAQVAGWDPGAAEHAGRLNAEQQARVAIALATAAVQRTSPSAATRGQLWFDAIVAVIPPHRTTNFARTQLIEAALEADPRRAAPVLREIYPDDPAVAACIDALDALGQPCDATLTLLDGRQISLREHRGSVVALQFFRPGSAASDSALASAMSRLQEQHGAELVAFGISLGRGRADAERVAAHASLAIHHDGLGPQTPLAARHLINVTPYYLLVDRAGALRFRGRGFASDATTRIQELLAETAPPGAR